MVKALIKIKQGNGKESDLAGCEARENFRRSGPGEPHGEADTSGVPVMQRSWQRVF